MQFLASFINTFTDPASVFNELKEKNNWQTCTMPLVMLMVVGSISLVVLKDLYYDVQLEQSIEWIENSSQIPYEQKEEALENVYESFENPGTVSVAIMWLSNILAGPLRVIFFTLIVLLIVKFFFGESAKYSELLPYISYAYLVTVLETIVKTPLMLSKWSIEVYTGLGLLGIGEKGTFIYNLLAGIDLFSIWRIVLIGIALGVFFNKNAKPFIIGISIYWLFQLSLFAGIAAIFT